MSTNGSDNPGPADGSGLTAAPQALAAACRRLGAAGLVAGSAGNVSLRSGGLVAVTASGTRLDRLTPEQVVIVDLDGRPVAGLLRPTTELALHLGVHRDRGDGAVVHTHAPLSTAVACCVDELPAVHYQVVLDLGGPVRVAPYQAFGSPELAATVLQALEGRRAALMSNHGAVTVGPDLESAVEATLVLEWLCSVYLSARLLGSPRLLDGAQQAAVRARAAALGYGTRRPPGPAEPTGST